MDRPRTSDTRSSDRDRAAARVAALVTGPQEPLRVDDLATVVELAAQLEQAGYRERALREQLQQVHLQLAERDALIEQLADVPGAAHGRERHELSVDLEAERRARRQDRERSDHEHDRVAAEHDRLAAALTGAQERLAAVEATRAWRVARRWWRVKERFRGG